MNDVNLKRENTHAENLLCRDWFNCEFCKIKLSNYEVVIELIRKELLRAMSIFPCMVSHHEGIAVIRKEYLELEKEVFEKFNNTKNIETEAIQLAAMCIRLITEL